MRNFIPPRDFREEVERANRNREPGDLELLATEARGFEWTIEGLRLVGHAQLDLKAFEGARDTWKAVRELEPLDQEANSLLGIISQSLGSTESRSPGGRRTDEVAASRSILLFTGHMIDSPDRAQARFPAAKIEVARQKIAEAVSAEQASSGGIAYGLAGCANGGDIIFHQVCEALHIPTKIFLAVPRELYLRESVAPAGPHWIEEFNRLVKAHPVRILGNSLELPGWLREQLNYNVWQRNNLWTLHSALSATSGNNVTLIALWNGAAGDGPGGTEDMVAKARERGAKIIILDPQDL